MTKIYLCGADEHEPTFDTCELLLNYYGHCVERVVLTEDAVLPVEDLILAVFTADTFKALLKGNFFDRYEYLPIALVDAKGNFDQSLPCPQQLHLLDILTTPIEQHVFLRLLHHAQSIQAYIEGTEERLAAQCTELLGVSDAIQSVRTLIARVAQTDASVLVLGESGSGKELVAQSIHRLSARATFPLVPVNCGAIPGELLESELFGHEKGAFTGAISARQGRFELAQGGTLFLDEIGDMPLPMQVKLLRVLQERSFERVGSNKTIKADVRLIAATHRHLEDAITSGTFREDLFYRLNVFPIELPPLRERQSDVPILISDLITKIKQADQPDFTLTTEAIDCLSHYAWPGNVRELSNLIERLLVLYAGKVVALQDLPEKFRAGYEGKSQQYTEVDLIRVKRPEPTDVSPAPSGELPNGQFDLKAHIIDLEVSYIQQALDDCDWVVARAAERLSMRRTTLVEKMRKYNIQKSIPA